MPTDEFLSEIHLDSIAEALSVCFPDLAPLSPLRYLDTGFSSFVVETPGEVILRIARHAAAGQAYVRERASLPLLRPYLPLPVPDVRWYAPPGSLMPYGAIGYRKLAGRPFVKAALNAQNRDRIAQEVAQFLTSLHAIPPETVPALVTQQPQERIAEWAILHAECLAALDGVLTSEEYYQIAAWWDEFLADPLLMEYKPVVRHGDLWFGNMLLNEEAEGIAGVLDFETTAVGDPAEDFAAQCECSEDFARVVLEKYRAAGGLAEDSMAARAARLYQVRPFGALRWAVQFEDAAELADAVAKLRQGPILRGTERKSFPA